jgi:translation initiation factor IF-3
MFRRRHDGPRINNMITAPTVRLISATGEQLGIFAAFAAVKMAEEEGLDLVEISPTADPPVCKIMDYGKYKYEKQKKEQESKKKQIVTVVKEIKLRPTTDTHDLEFKLNHVKRFIAERDKVKITMQFRGREMMFIDRGKETLKKIVQDLASIAEPESPPKTEGKSLSVMLGPKTPGKKS